MDFLAVSFVRSGEDVEEARRLFREAGGKGLIVAKIERAEAVDDIEAIVDEERFLGNWALKMPNGDAGWLTLSMTDGKPTGELWCVGSTKGLRSASTHARADGRHSAAA